jgi:hypothetical protein
MTKMCNILDIMTIGVLRNKTIGTVTRVVPDWDFIASREDSHGDIIGAYHSQPNNDTPSTIDCKTFMVWDRYLGKQCYQLISTFENSKNMYEVVRCFYMDGLRLDETKAYRIFNIVFIIKEN